MTNKTGSTFYTGVTNNLERRVHEHREKLVEGFTSKYNIVKLVYYEMCGDINSAITWEKRLKKWRRAWKEELIRKQNPEWRDLSEDWRRDPGSSPG